MHTEMHCTADPSLFEVEIADNKSKWYNSLATD